MSFKVCRVVAVNSAKQTVDITKSASYTSWLIEQQRDETADLIKDVPYVSPAVQDYSLPYVWGFFTSGQPSLSSDFWREKDKYGNQFFFGRYSNPAYLEEIHNKYYKEKGTNPKSVTGGTTYRPQEGSLAIFDDESFLVVGFISQGGYVSKERRQYLAPNTKNADDEFHRKWNALLEDENGGEKTVDLMVRSAHSTLGYDYEVEREVDTERELIDEINPATLRSRTYPVSNNSIFWQQINPARIQPISGYYQRYKQSELKRISDIYNTSTSGNKNKALIDASDDYDRNAEQLFNSGKEFIPEQTTLSTSNYSLTDTNIFENYVDEPTGDKRFAYEEPVHVIPESGIKHFHDGKILIYSDSFGSFADLNKPTNYEEFFSNESDFYSKTKWTSGRAEYKSFIKNYLKYIREEAVDDEFLYKFDRFKVKEQELEDEEREIESFDDRGSYISVDPAYIEMSSDSKKGGWLLQKYGKKYELGREYSKTTIFAPFEVFSDLVNGTGSASSSVTHDFDNNDPSLFGWEIPIDYRIKEGTYGIEAPLFSTRTYRQHHLSLESIALESKGSGGSDHYAGVYIGKTSYNSETGTNATDDGGSLLLVAGNVSPVGGNLKSSQTRAYENQGGKIVLDAHEIHLNCNRLLMGQVRMDQKDKMTELNLAKILLSLIPVEGSALQKIGDILYNNYPINNKSSLSTFSPRRQPIEDD